MGIGYSLLSGTDNIFIVTLISIYKQKPSPPTDITEESFYNFAIKPREALPLLSPLKMKQPTSVCNGCWRMTMKVQLPLFSCIFLDNQNKSVMVLSKGKLEGTLMRQRSANETKKANFCHYWTSFWRRTLQRDFDLHSSSLQTSSCNCPYDLIYLLPMYFKRHTN